MLGRSEVEIGAAEQRDDVQHRRCAADGEVLLDDGEGAAIRRQRRLQVGENRLVAAHRTARILLAARRAQHRGRRRGFPGLERAEGGEEYL